AAKAVQQAARDQTLLAIIFVDLDHFKNINDSLGHAEGDRLLKTVSERLGRALRQGDVLGRQGGDEFVVVLPALQSQENAAEVAQRMLTELSEPVMLGITEFTISASLGIAVYPEDGNDVTTLLKHADTAMYAAKGDGRNNFRFFVQEMNDRVHQQVILENGLRRALRDDEFTLFYQPQIEYVTGRVAGVEALLRWPHPELGNIPPDRFIPVAENCGLIDQLGRWVMRAAFTQQRLWSALGYENLLVSINVSALQLARPDFVDQVRQLLQQTGANPMRIDFEITETAIRDANEALLQRLDELINMGLTLSLDDFGTGYSGLGALKGLPLHRIKLDRSFIYNLPDDIENAAITTASLAMASALGLDVVAEGVESAEHRDFLASYGCRFMQGYFFARPMSADDFIARFPPDRVI
ncbi:MAG: EAL domain-containing protein, partial [Rhodocyclaceae bacterium]|nr:EAL domain-containing protein [Rhodocyclaceae bacterium]